MVDPFRAGRDHHRCSVPDAGSNKAGWFRSRQLKGTSKNLFHESIAALVPTSRDRNPHPDLSGLRFLRSVRLALDSLTTLFRGALKLKKGLQGHQGHQRPLGCGDSLEASEPSWYRSSCKAVRIAESRTHNEKREAGREM